jgi:ABC-type spermidine/putrescine transport system permease subunit I
MSIDTDLVSASRILGASYLQTIRSIVFPLSLSGVIAAGLIVFILATGSFLAPAVLGGPGNTMIANIIEQAFSDQLNIELASALAVVYTTLLLVLIMGFNSYINIGKVLGDL